MLYLFSVLLVILSVDPVCQLSPICLCVIVIANLLNYYFFCSNILSSFKRSKSLVSTDYFFFFYNLYFFSLVGTSLRFLNSRILVHQIYYYFCYYYSCSRIFYASGWVIGKKFSRILIFKKIVQVKFKNPN